MKKNHPFVVSILSKRDAHPLQAAASISGERMLDLSSIAAMESTDQTEMAPPKRLSKVVFSDLLTVEREDPRWKDLPNFMQIRKGARMEVVRNARNTLWMRVAWSEKRDDAQFARLFQMDLPTEIPLEKCAEALRTFSQERLANLGMIVDIAIHEVARDGELSRRTAYAMATTREFRDGSFGNKDRSWNQRSMLFAWRKQWFETLSATLGTAETDEAGAPDHSAWKNLCEKYTVTLARDPKEALASAPALEPNETPLLEGEPAAAPAPRRRAL